MRLLKAFHTLKIECVHHCDYASREEARASFFEYIEVFYNRVSGLTLPLARSPSGL